MRREDERKYIGGRRGGRDGQLRMEGRTGVRQRERVVFKGRKENPKLHALPVVAEFKGTWSTYGKATQQNCISFCNARGPAGPDSAYVSKPGLKIL